MINHLMMISEKSRVLGNRTVQRQWVGALLLCAFLISPLVIHDLRNIGTRPPDILLLFNLSTSLLWLLFLHAMVRRPLNLHLLLFPFYLCTAIDLFLVNNFNSRLSSGYVTVALSNLNEAGDLVSTFTRPLLLAFLMLLCIYVPCVVGIRNLHKQRSRRLASVAAGLLVFIYTAAIGRDLIISDFGSRAALWDVAGKELSAPFGIIFQSAVALSLYGETKELRKQRENHTFLAERAKRAASSKGEIYVWVVGESSRPQNWSLFGYVRDTTPRLRTMRGLVGLPDMLSTAPHTSVAVPSMLSLRPITDWNSVAGEKSILEAFNEVGFKTYWLSSQGVDKWGGAVIPLVAAEASYQRYFDSGYDGAMLAEFQTILRRASVTDNLFIVIHTKGSHFDYFRRYPSEFARFASQDGSRREQLVDAYDNSVLYTDWFLSELIGTLSEQHKRSALFYASDHGENLLDDDKQLLGHAVGTRYDLSSAAFIWLSEAMAASRSEQAARLKKNASAALSLSNLSHSMLDLAFVDTKELDKKMSVFSAGFSPVSRSYIVRGKLLRWTQ